MESKGRDDKAFVAELETITLPHIDNPLFKAQLKSRLLAEAALPTRRGTTNSTAWWRYALVAAAFLAVLSWQLMPRPLPALAYLEIEVNPSVRLTVNSRRQVVNIEPLDEQAKLALQGFDVLGQPAIRVVPQVLEWLHRAAPLNHSSEIWLIVSPLGDAQPEVIDRLLSNTQTAASLHAQHLLAGAVTTHGLVIDRVRYAVAKQGALRPSQYARVAKAGISAYGMRALVAAGTRLKATGKLTDDQTREFMDLVAELLELGISEGEAAELIESLLVKGHSTRNLVTRIERAVERIEKGQEAKEAVRELREETERVDDEDEADERDEDETKESRPDKEQERGRDNKDPRGNEGTRGDDSPDHRDQSDDDQTEEEEKEEGEEEGGN